MFFISAAIFGIGGVVYIIFGSSDLEKWAVIDDENKE